MKTAHLKKVRPVAPAHHGTEVRVFSPSSVLDEALHDWAEAYGAQTVKDHAALVRAIKSGRVEVAREA
jgi:DNA-binding GntR family transcriptional regulator